MNTSLNLLCAGAAQGLVKALEGRLQQECAASLHASFGAVGAMKEALMAGAPCDLMIVTDAMIQALAEEGQMIAPTCTPIGRVFTGIAVCAGQPQPDVATPDALRAALQAATAVYFPDAVRSTAGIHFARVMTELGLLEELQPRWRTFPNGATAMREMAAANEPGAIGCTQQSEILYTPGVQWVGRLPARFELATLYSAAVCARAEEPAVATAFMDMLAGEEAALLRRDGGFFE